MILCRSSAVVAVVVDVVVDVAAAAVAAYGHLAGCTKNKIKQKQPRATTSICCELKNFLLYATAEAAGGETAAAAANVA